MLNSIQTLRALAAWLVVFHHYLQFFYNFKLTDPLSVAISQYGAIGVDLFFVISGFVIYSSTINRHTPPLHFLAHRLARIAPAYWLFTCLVAVSLINFKGLVAFTEFEPFFLLKSLAFLPAENPSGIGLFPLLTVGWTLNYEMAFYAIFFLALYAPKKLKLPAIALGICILEYLLPKLNGNFSFYANKIVFEFLMGILIALIYQKDWLKYINLPTALTLAVGSIYTITTTAGVNHEPIRFGTPCFFLVIASLSQEKYFPKNAFIGKLGDWSYSTYLSHVLVICYMYKAQNAFNLSPTTTLIIICLTILIISNLSYTLIEKPFTKLTKKLLSKGIVLKLNKTQPAQPRTPEDRR